VSRANLTTANATFANVLVRNDHHTRRAGVESATRDAAERAGAGGGADVPATPIVSVQRTETGQQTDTCLRCDPELARIAVAIHKANQLRVWVVMREMTRQTSHMALKRDKIREALRQHGVTFTDRSFNRWIVAGDKTFWNIDVGANVIYPASPVLVAQRLLKLCADAKLYDLYTTNHPGQRKDMFIDVSGTNTRAFEQHVYETWMASRNNPSISRWTLSRLWDRHPVSLRLLEDGSQLEILANFAFCDIENSEYVPFDAEGERRRDVHKVKIDGRYGWQWQISNTYFAPRIRQNDKRGVSRRVLYTLKRKHPELQATSASDADGETVGSLNRSHKMFYSSRAKALSNAKSYGEMVRYVLLGREDGNKAIYEVSPDGRERFEFWSCAATLRRTGESVHSSAMCSEVVSHPF
jgi:hypothetical protein